MADSDLEKGDHPHSHHIHGHAIHTGRRLRHFLHPSGRKVHVASTPDKAERLKRHLSVTEPDGFDLAIHGSPDHVWPQPMLIATCNWQGIHLWLRRPLSPSSTFPLPAIATIPGSLLCSKLLELDRVHAECGLLPSSLRNLHRKRGPQEQLGWVTAAHQAACAYCIVMLKSPQGVGAWDQSRP
ncbi:hypothetical protein EJ06DRAFT_305084 [Trichodelitschia bisporula]|uniref:Uncharacterized protein n=1 Tax=Trichodelitschia bisporula TaxID=703511 RepID=A0A6G1HHL8_9PEZI|nr:hypothetical protein EJ06DRAFT_305084 [Trichodelitschia bisporula]